MVRFGISLELDGVDAVAPVQRGLRHTVQPVHDRARL
jgi:hypothetical protein